MHVLRHNTCANNDSFQSFINIRVIFNVTNVINAFTEIVILYQRFLHIEMSNPLHNCHHLFLLRKTEKYTVLQIGISGLHFNNQCKVETYETAAETTALLLHISIVESFKAIVS